MKNITYIFSKNRKESYLENNIEAKEFFYGLTEFSKKDSNIKIIEFNNRKNPFTLIFSFIDKVMNKLFSLPFYTSKVVTINNLKILLKTDNLFLVNESVGCSALPLLIVTKIFKKINVSLFVMGLYSKNLRFKKLRIFHQSIIKFLILFVDNVIFLGEGEMNKASMVHKKKLEKFSFLPFSVDTEFWTPEKNFDVCKNEKIIFVGNDGNRDYELLIELARKMVEYNFVFISTNEKIIKIDLPNVKVIKGYWGSKEVSDEKLKRLYCDARFSIIPLKESYQPSGQSVSLQSMSLGLPVIITETKGFWNKEDFIDNKNIFFVSGDKVQNWINKITDVFEDEKRISKISTNAKKIVNSKYDLNSFYNKLLNLID